MKAITVQIPGSKSLTNRALIISALANGKSTVANYSRSKDSHVLIHALKELGVIIREANGALEINGNGGSFHEANVTVDVGDAGTAYRFMTALATLVPGGLDITGSRRLLERPIAGLKEALAGFDTGEVSIDGSKSSQFVSALLMIGPCLPRGLRVIVTGNTVSKSYINMTISIMEEYGVEVKLVEQNVFLIPKSEYIPCKYIVEPDASGASYFWAIAAVTGRKITITGINKESAQGDLGFPALLSEIGCRVERGPDYVTVTGPEELKGIEADMESMPDTAQTLAVVAAFAKGTTTITGLSTLKVKETDRLAAMKSELGKIGIETEITGDSITIYGGKPKPAAIETYGDHRMAMAFAVAKARIPDVKINDPEVVGKSFPDFWEKYKEVISSIK